MIRFLDLEYLLNRICRTFKPDEEVPEEETVRGSCQKDVFLAGDLLVAHEHCTVESLRKFSYYFIDQLFL